MPRLNVPGAGHIAPIPIEGYQWLPFTNDAYLASVRQALTIIDTRIRGYAPCDAAFRALPRGRSFADLWNDPNIWISFDPDGRAIKFGGRIENDITLSQYACRMGQWTIVSTLVHEMAHIGGATGPNNDAESTLKSCLMRAHYNPNIIGQLRSAARGSGLLATNSMRDRGRSSRSNGGVA